MTDSKKDINDIYSIYGEDCLLKKDDFLKKHNVNLSGLTNSEVENKISHYGINQLKHAKEKKWYNYFLRSLLSPFNCILLGITLVLAYTDIILPQTPSYANIIVIVVLVLVSTLLEFFEEYRSNQAASKLRSLVETSTTVLRNGEKSKVPITNITIGDMVILSAGDMVPADIRIIESKDLYVGQSSLTGESDAVKKSSDSEIENKADIESITDLDTICFMGTNVISGSAKGIVIKIANDTYFGKVAKSIDSGKPQTSFQKGIKNVSRLLIRFMLIMIPITFLVNAWKHDTLTAFTFAVAIAIGITPLLLPVILSSSLAKGAVRMSKKKTIVKQLDSIQSFGAMNILCTDKTGTLNCFRKIFRYKG